MAIQKGKSAPAATEASDGATPATPKSSLKKNAGGGGSFASKFDTTKAGGFVSFPPGKHEGNIVSLEWDGDADPEAEGKLAAKITYSTDIDGEDKEGSQWYQVRTAEGDVGKGIGFLKSDLAKLGYEDVSFEEMEAVFQEVTNERPAVSFTSKVNGGYTNLYLNGLVNE